jgi:hypothetical protein
VTRTGEGGEWEPVKILQQNLAYVQKQIQHVSLLTLSRPHNYKKLLVLRIELEKLKSKCKHKSVQVNQQLVDPTMSHEDRLAAPWFRAEIRIELPGIENRTPGQNNQAAGGELIGREKNQIEGTVNRRQDWGCVLGTRWHFPTADHHNHEHCDE